MLSFSVTFSPKDVHADAQDLAVSLWRSNADHLLEDITLLVSPSNVYFLTQSPNGPETWNRLEHLLGRLLRSGLLTPLTLETQCVELLRRDWDQGTLSRMAGCFQGVVETWRKGGGSDRREDFDQMMEWVLWFWQEAEAREEEDMASFERDFPLLG